jgi:glycosyltransferase involved in cell wall biosynthesis
MKKVLLSAFGCAPNRGSDAEVGWKWATTLAAAGHDVWVMTREVNREVVESELEKIGTPANLHFLYYEIGWLLKLTTKIYGRIYFYYYLWQWGAYRKARAAHKAIRFDVAHHVTWVSVRQPSFMGRLGIPFYFGPVAGGETAPWRLRSGFSLRQWAADILRDSINFLVRIDPLMWWTFSSAAKIYVTSEQTLHLVPRRFRKKAVVQLAIATDWVQSAQENVRATERTTSAGKGARVLYVGRFIGWKGMHIGLRAFAELLNRVPDATLTMVGRGPDEKAWRRLASSLSLDDRIEWIPWTDRDTLRKLYATHDIFLFPSLHESGGLVVLEALAHGLPVVCLELGGPGVIVDDNCGIRVSTRGLGRREAVHAVAESLCRLAEDSVLREKLLRGAFGRAKQFDWHSLVTRVYGSA